MNVLEMGAGRRVHLHVKYQLLLYDFNQIWNGSANFN
jgi:hypothetical protein